MNKKKEMFNFDFFMFRQLMFDPMIQLDDLVDYNGEPLAKIVYFWRKKKLMPFVGFAKHLELTFLQFIWIQILDTLRQFTYPVEKMKILCKYLFEDAYNDHLPKLNLQYNKELLDRKKQLGVMSEDELQNLDWLNKVLKDDIFLYILKFDINYLSNLVSGCLTTRSETGLLIFNSGEIGEYSDGEYFSHTMSVVNPMQPHIYLSISYFLQQFVDSNDLLRLINTKNLNDDEKLVLSHMRSKKTKEINILRQGQDLQIETDMDGIIKGESAKAMRKLLDLKDYETLTFYSRNDNTVSFMRSQKHNKRSR